MAHVNFKASAFVGGRRFQKGLHEVPDDLLDRLPSSAQVVDARSAEAVRAKMAADAEAARKPQALKDLRAGRLKPALPMGKEPAKPIDGDKAQAPRTDANAEIDDLRAEYQELTGKKPFGAWKEDELKRRIEKAREGDA